MLTRAQQLEERARKVRELADTAMTEEGRSILCELAQRYEFEASSVVDPAPNERLAEAAA